MIDILSAFGLSAATGLNAYLPLLIVGLLARFTDLITLSTPWDTLENPWVLGVLGVLLIIEMTVDKIPAADTVNDVIQTVVRPAAGAVLFAASSSTVTNVSPALALICGLMVAGGVHAAKATARPIITASTMGVANPVVSVAEDVVSGTTALVSVIVPAVAAVLILIVLLLFIGWWINRRSKSMT